VFAAFSILDRRTADLHRVFRDRARPVFRLLISEIYPVKTAVRP
jgi:hypothetical protein